MTSLGRVAQEPNYNSEEIPDDRLRLIFSCCHPALALEAQVALTLRTLCGLETDEIARAFLVPGPTMAQRLVRAKHKIRDAGIPHTVPETSDLPPRPPAETTGLLVEEALRGGPGPFSLQAAIAALHCQAARQEDTDWRQIVRLYDVLERLQPSPVVSPNRAVAVAMVDGPQQDWQSSMGWPQMVISKLPYLPCCARRIAPP